MASAAAASSPSTATILWRLRSPLRRGQADLQRFAVLARHFALACTGLNVQG